MTDFGYWILENAEIINLRVQELTWCKNLGLEIQEFSASISINGVTYNGHGSSTEPTLAMEKAVAEAIERAVALQCRTTTNGIAAHPDKQRACLLARDELIERDLFLSQWIQQIPFCLFITQKTILISQLEKNLEKFGHQLLLLKSRPSNLGTCIIAVILGISGEPKFGTIFGLAFGDPTDAGVLDKSALEAFSQYIHLRENSLLTKSLSLVEFNSKALWTLNYHMQLSLNPASYAVQKHMFTGEDANTEGVSYGCANFSYSELKPVAAVLEETPLTIISCESSACQNLVIGNFNRLNLNSDIVDAITNNSKLPMPYLLPHPLS